MRASASDNDKCHVINKTGRLGVGHPVEAVIPFRSGSAQSGRKPHVIVIWELTELTSILSALTQSLAYKLLPSHLRRHTDMGKLVNCVCYQRPMR